MHHIQLSSHNPYLTDAVAASRSQRAGQENSEALPNPWGGGTTTTQQQNSPPSSGGGNTAPAGGIGCKPQMFRWIDCFDLILFSKFSPAWFVWYEFFDGTDDVRSCYDAVPYAAWNDGVVQTESLSESSSDAAGKFILCTSEHDMTAWPRYSKEVHSLKHSRALFCWHPVTFFNALALWLPHTPISWM